MKTEDRDMLRLAARGFGDGGFRFMGSQDRAVRIGNLLSQLLDETEPDRVQRQWLVHHESAEAHYVDDSGYPVCGARFASKQWRTVTNARPCQLCKDIVEAGLG